MPNSTTPTQGRKTAGAFDIRNFIGALLGVYGVILTFLGIFGDQELDKTNGINANLYAGIALLVVGVGFMTWARVRPVIVPPHVAKPTDDPGDAGDPGSPEPG